MKNRTDLILGEAFCVFIVFYFLDSRLSVLNGLQFNFRLRDSENREFHGYGALSHARFARGSPAKKNTLVIRSLQKGSLIFKQNKYSL